MGTQTREELTTRPELAVAPPALRTWATVDLAAVRHNVRAARRVVGEGVGVAAVVKADAYGHGAVPVARAALDAGAGALVVANAAEGVALRQAAVTAPIIIAGASFPADADAIVACDLQACISPPEMLDAIAEAAARRQKTARVHLMADLGMARDGVTWDEALGLAARVRDLAGVDLEGVASHFPTADDPDTSFSEGEIEAFRRLLAEVAGLGLRPRYAHLAASAALLRMPAAHFNLVRAGIMLYGMAAGPTVEGLADPRPALTWRTRVVYVRRVAAGTPVGYGHAWTAPRDTVLATLPVGYHDGYLRCYSNNADVLLRGQRAPVVGRVAMDYTVVDVGHIPGVAVGDVATLLGRDGADRIPAEELAARRGTIPYEVTCALGTRVERLYLGREGQA
ncbi:MAG: alanine racemase [bacterium]